VCSTQTRGLNRENRFVAFGRLGACRGYCSGNQPPRQSNAEALMASLRPADVRPDRPEQVVVLDSWWSGDYAKNQCDSDIRWIETDKKLINQYGCEAVTACPEVMPRYARARMRSTKHSGQVCCRRLRDCHGSWRKIGTVNYDCSPITDACVPVSPPSSVYVPPIVYAPQRLWPRTCPLDGPGAGGCDDGARGRDRRDSPNSNNRRLNRE
jgi:hypothetical protein